MEKKIILTLKIKEIIQLEWKSTNIVQDAIKKLYTKKKNKLMLIFYFRIDVEESNNEFIKYKKINIGVYGSKLLYY